MKRRARRIASLAVAAALTALAIASAVAFGRYTPESHGGTLAPRFVPTAVSQRAARRDVTAQLAALRLPPAARTVDRHSPLTDPVLAEHFAYLENFVGNSYATTRFAWTPETSREALAWIVHHPPPGSALVVRREPNQVFAWLRCRFFERPDGRPYDAERLLQICATTHHGGATLRIDSQAEWLEGRSRYSRVPRGARYLELIASRPGEPPRRALVHDRRFIEGLVALANSLPIVQRSGPYCSADEEAGRIAIVFRTERSGQPLAQLTQLLPATECRLLGFSVHGRAERSLAESGLVLRALRPVIDSLPAPRPARRPGPRRR